jgi:hypothetical protein
MPVDDTKDPFGFDQVRRPSNTVDKIKQIKPTLPPDVHTDLAAVDAAGDKAGFVSREAQPDVEPDYRPVRMPKAELRVVINMRCPKRAGQAFMKFCADNRYSYPEGLIEIMQRAGIPTK